MLSRLQSITPQLTSAQVDSVLAALAYSRFGTYTWWSTSAFGTTTAAWDYNIAHAWQPALRKAQNLRQYQFAPSALTFAYLADAAWAGGDQLQWSIAEAQRRSKRSRDERTWLRALVAARNGKYAPARGSFWAARVEDPARYSLAY